MSDIYLIKVTKTSALIIVNFSFSEINIADEMRYFSRHINFGQRAVQVGKIIIELNRCSLRTNLLGE
ncbi:hypothetical protein TUM4438_06900 [Shewanella sairae]|uniref:Uncharacterized protein n=1 Tax=Shewanella sairae TaxID=190310 RepID=A0ABQ4P2Q7_9GAMM|nr:hypothetical protein TUM4438_06900 [Shewanella sairae]